MIANGMTSKEISATLFIAPRTAETHVDHIRGKQSFANARKPPPGSPPDGGHRGLRIAPRRAVLRTRRRSHLQSTVESEADRPARAPPWPRSTWA
ncbi:LuxR C-terminal-related transcriptional regulator [Amycolatopsis sp. NBC_00345]|uniref:LuxR C-terminal-related transcriptional regulator n=1 Tax=Amycolatopsis sp. NBC_00345 TaxID=2975955 RepID=UPI002E273E9D